MRIRPHAIVLPSLLLAADASAGGPVGAWGSNVYGQSAVPATLGACLGVAGGGAHSVALRTSGQVVCWGDNSLGQCNVPASLGTCVMVSAGEEHTLALKSTGVVAAWGDNAQGQVTVPAAVGTCKQIAAGGWHNVALRTNGSVVAWGLWFDGQTAVPSSLQAAGACLAVEAGAYHSLAIRANGTVAAWGLNDYGQVGVPANLGTVTAVAAGDSHNAVVRTDGGVSCWGYNGQGQCSIPALKACTGIACGAYHTVALQQDGTVAAWGLSDFGQCTVPALLSKSTQVAAGGSHSLALTTNVVAPTGVSATDGTSLVDVTVTWNPVSGVTGMTGYRIFRAAGTGLGVQIGDSPGPTTFIDSTAVAGTAYSYWVKTKTSLGDSASSTADPGWRNVAAPTGLAATDGTVTTGVNLSWTGVTGVTGYRVYRSSPTSAAAELAQPTGTAYSDTSAVAGTVYTYTVRSRMQAGNSAESNADSGWRGPTVPAPTGLDATDGSRTDAVALAWSAVPGATGYKVFRAIGSATPAQLATPTAAEYLDTSASPGVVYTYTVRARTASAESASSASNTGWRAPPAPAGVQATDGTLTTGVNVTWTAVPGVTGYKVFRAAGSGAATQVAAPAAGATSHADTAAVAGTLYTYTVRASSPSGDSAPSNEDTGWRNLPAPTGVTAGDGVSISGVAVSWTAVPGATGYRVYRTPTGGAAELAGTLAAGVTTFADTGAVAGTPYSFTVRTRSAAGDSAPSAADAGWRNVSVPTGVSATDGTSSAQVRITWALHPSTAVTGYRIIRTVPGAGTTVLADVAGRATLAFTDTTVPEGTTTQYAVQASTAAGLSAMSAVESGWRNVPAPTGLAASDGTSAASVVITWTISPSTKVTGYRVLRLLPGEAAATPIAVVFGRTTATYSDSTIAVGVTGTYSLQAQTAPGFSAASATDTGFRAGAGGMAPPEGPDGGSGGVTDGAIASTGASGDGGRTGGAGSAGGTGGRTTGAEWTGATAGVRAVTCAEAIARARATAAQARRDGDDRSAARLEALLPDSRRAGAGSPGDVEGNCPACRALSGDVNLDGVSDAEDLAAFMDAWFAGDAVAGDLDRDGTCDGTDLARLLAALGTVATR